MYMHQLHVLIPVKLWRKLMRVAKKQRRTVTEVIKQLIEATK